MTQATQNSGVFLSALMDGQLRGDEFAQTLEWLQRDEEARLTWHSYHLLGDVLRSGESIASLDDAAFVQRLRVGLQKELSHARRLGTVVDQISIQEAADSVETDEGITRNAANDASGRWKLLAGLASLAAVLAIGWQSVVGIADQGDARMVMIRDPQLDALLAAHRQTGGTSALQMSAGFLRNATFEGASR